MFPMGWFICVTLVGTSMPWPTLASSPSRGRTWMWAGQATWSPSATPSTPPGEASARCRCRICCSALYCSSSRLMLAEMISVLLSSTFGCFSQLNRAPNLLHITWLLDQTLRTKWEVKPKLQSLWPHIWAVFVFGYARKLFSAPNRSNTRSLDVEAACLIPLGVRRERKTENCRNYVTPEFRFSVAEPQL